MHATDKTFLVLLAAFASGCALIAYGLSFSSRFAALGVGCATVLLSLVMIRAFFASR